MYARISKISAVNEMQLNMFIETYKNVGAKTAMKAGAVQLTRYKRQPSCRAYKCRIAPHHDGQRLASKWSPQDRPLGLLWW